MQRVESRHSTQGVLTSAQIDGHYEMLVEHPFDSTIKRMATAWKFIPEDTSADAKDYDILICMSQIVRSHKHTLLTVRNRYEGGR